MNTTVTFAHSSNTPGAVGLLGAVRCAIRHVTWRAAGATLAVAVALDLWLLMDVFYGRGPGQSVPEQYLSGAIINLIMAYCIMFTTLVANERVAAGARPVPAYVWAVVIGSAAGSLVHWSANEWLLLSPRYDRLPLAFFEYLIWGSIIVFIYVSRRGALLAGARKSAAQLHRAEAQRSTLESRLQALQARVEPQFLLSTLAQVRDLYESEPEKGRQVLGDLIVYLRAALPHLRRSTSTLGQELDLAGAYANIMRAKVGEDFQLHVDATGATRAAGMPSMLLLPLIDHVLTRRLAARTGQGTIGVSARTEAEKLRVEIADSGQAFAAEGQGADLEVIRDRLHALYGDGGVLTCESSGERGTQVILEIPLGGTDGHRR